MDVAVGGGNPDFLHNGRDQVVCLEVLGAKLLTTLGASDAALGLPPVLADAELAKVVHASQHDRFPEEVATHGARQVVSQADLG